MTKFRRSFFVIWVAAVTLVAVLGPDVAAAARFMQRGAAPSAKPPVRRTIGPCAGEPDNGNNGAPIKVTTPSVAGPAGTSWVLDQALQIMWKRQFQRHSRTR